MTTARTLRHLAHNLTKQLLLWHNDCQTEKSRENVSYYRSLRPYLEKLEQEEVEYQNQLAARRQKIERSWA